MEERILRLEKYTITNLLSDEKVITFYNLGLLSKGDSDTWVVLHSPNRNFGYLVDFHTLLEHITYEITGMDALKQLQNIYKLKLSTILEALAVTSFEVTIPRF